MIVQQQTGLITIPEKPKKKPVTPKANATGFNSSNNNYYYQDVQSNESGANEIDFSVPISQKLPEYDSKNDAHLKSFFQSKQRRRHLRRMQKIMEMEIRERKKKYYDDNNICINANVVNTLSKASSIQPQGKWPEVGEIVEQLNESQSQVRDSQLQSRKTYTPSINDAARLSAGDNMARMYKLPYLRNMTPTVLYPVAAPTVVKKRYALPAQNVKLMQQKNMQPINEPALNRSYLSISLKHERTQSETHRSGIYSDLNKIAIAASKSVNNSATPQNLYSEHETNTIDKQTLLKIEDQQLEQAQREQIPLSVLLQPNNNNNNAKKNEAALQTPVAKTGVMRSFQPPNYFNGGNPSLYKFRNVRSSSSTAGAVAVAPPAAQVATGAIKKLSTKKPGEGGLIKTLDPEHYLQQKQTQQKAQPSLTNKRVDNESPNKKIVDINLNPVSNEELKYVFERYKKKIFHQSNSIDSSRNADVSAIKIPGPEDKLASPARSQTQNSRQDTLEDTRYSAQPKSGQL